MVRRCLALLGVLVVAAWLFSSFSVATGQPQAGPTAQLVIGSLEEPGSLSALADLPHHFPEHVPQTLLFDSLIQYRPDGTIGPKLAQKWEVSADGLSYTFMLSPSARFHDGAPVTADDVKFTIESALDPKTNSSDEGLDVVSQVEALDPQTVRIRLKQFTPWFLAQGGSRGIVPKHVLAGKDLAKDEFNQRPIGSGPYRIVSFAPGQSIVMEAVPDFYRGAAKIGRVIFRILPDQNVILTQLRSGEIQYATLAPRDLPVVQRMNGLRVVEVPTLRSYDIAPNYQRVYWQDVRVRRAVLMAINRDGIVQRVLLGHGRVIDANVTPASWAYNSNIPRHPYDPAAARTLLDEAGWRPSPGGIRGKNGQRLSFGVMINNFDRTLEQVLTVAQQDLRKVGVEMRIERVEPGIFGSRRKDHTFDALSRVWNPVYDPDQSVLVHSGNFYGYSNPAADELTKAAASTFDREQRKRGYGELQRVLSDDVARLWLYTDNELHAVPATLQGVQPHPVNFFWNIKDWQLGR